MDNFRKITLREPGNFPADLNFLLDLITFNETPKVVGSYAYKNHKYPSVVDVFERFSVNFPRESAMMFYQRGFINIIQKLIIYSDKVFINDFKIGLDIHGNPLRWTADQVLTGYQIKDGYQYSLRDSIAQPAVLKLDVISYISHKFQSIEVFYNLRFKNENEYIDIYPLGSYTKSLLEDINKYSQPDNYNPLKVAKRMWSLARVTNCDQLLELINPLLSSNAAALNQIRSDLSIISDVIEYLQKVTELRPDGSKPYELNRILN